jgi:hypothetical protein
MIKPPPHEPRDTAVLKGLTNRDPSKGITVREARLLYASIKVPTGVSAFGNMDSKAETGNATLDIDKNMRVVEVPDKDHPQTHSLRIVSAELENGEQRLAAMVCKNDTGEVTAAYVQTGADGSVDAFSRALVSHQDALYADSKTGLLQNGFRGLQFSPEMELQPFSDQQRQWVANALSGVPSSKSPLLVAGNQPPSQPALKPAPSLKPPTLST